MIDLESAGCLNLHGNDEHTTALLRYIAAELACNTWSDDVEIILAGFDRTEAELGVVERKPGTTHITGTATSAHIGGALTSFLATRCGFPVSTTYANQGGLFDVTSGSNGRCTHGRTSGSAYLCTAGAGYDGPTGLGTPFGSTSPF